MAISRFLKRLLEDDKFSGADIVAASRGVLAELYTKPGAENLPGLLIFVAIDDQTDYVLLRSYGPFNKPSYREYILYDDGTHFEGLGPQDQVEEGSPEFERDMEEILRSFGEGFRSAKLELLQHLRSIGCC